MENLEPFKATEIFDIQRQKSSDTVDIHACRQPGVMNLHTLNIMPDQERTPAVMNFAAVRQELEITLDYSGQAIRLAHAQSEAVLIEGTGR